MDFSYTHVVSHGAEITATCFDSEYDLFWVAEGSGHVTSYAGPELSTKYSAFRSQTGDIRAITSSSALVTVSNNTTRMSDRQGARSLTTTHESFKDLRCVAGVRAGKKSTVFVGGMQPNIAQVDVRTGQVTSVHAVNEDCEDSVGTVIIRGGSRFISAASSAGVVSLLDPRSLKIQQTFKMHDGAITDMDSSSNLLVTCGLTTSSRLGLVQTVTDPFIKLYDLRYTKAMQPLHITTGPTSLRFVPSQVYSSGQLLVLDQRNRFQLIDAGAGSTQRSFPTTVPGPCSSCDISSTGDVAIFCDATSTMHVYSRTAAAAFNYEPFNLERPEILPDTSRPAVMPDDYSYTMAFEPMLYTGQPLVSDYDYALSDTIFYRARPHVPLEVQASIRSRSGDFIGYASNVRKWKSNRVPYSSATLLARTPSSLKGGKVVTPGFKRQRYPKVKEVSPMKRLPDLEGISETVPKRYRRVDIKYSFFGVEDFDFAHYNRTNFAGLEIHIPNAYCNAMLQVLYFIGPFRQLAQMSNCDDEFCLVCELGYLFHMMNQVPGRNCQATNFLRTFRTIPQASALGLIKSEDDSEPGFTGLQSLIQSWHRFMLTQIDFRTRCSNSGEQPRCSAKTNRGDDLLSKETLPKKDALTDSVISRQTGREKMKDVSSNTDSNIQSNSPLAAPASDLWGSTVTTTAKCLSCLESASPKSSISMITELQAPPKSMSPEDLDKYSFSDMVRDSICHKKVTKAWCHKCKSYRTTTHTRSLANAPGVLAFNCNTEKDQERKFWEEKSKFPAHIDFESAEAQSADAESWIPHQLKLKILSGGELAVNEVKRSQQEEEADEASRGSVSEETTKLNGSDLPVVLDKLNPSTLPDNEVDVKKISVSENSDATVEGETVIYDLVAVVAHIRDSNSSGNLVATIRVSKPYHKLKEGISHTAWYVFNDFAVVNVPAREAVEFDMTWKVPVILYFARRGIEEEYSITPEIRPDESVLEKRLVLDRSLATTPREQHSTSFLPITSNSDLPGPGDLVGIDAEFVSIAKEEAEIRSDGHKSTIKPAHMACARVSLVHGSGPNKGQAFVDDFIKSAEPVIDYLTRFSGIKPGDLDPGISTKHLTTLKATCGKLRLLEVRGVTFVGHGLSKDFRVINMSPPKSQVIDTVDIYHIKGQRKLGLKFLSWFVLGIHMQQSEDGHDSIEDARIALQLYEKHLAVKAEGGAKWIELLNAIYEEGKARKYVPPMP